MVVATTKRIFSPAESAELWSILEDYHNENPRLTATQLLDMLKEEHPSLGERASLGTVQYRLTRLRSEAPDLTDAITRWRKATQNRVAAEQEEEEAKHAVVEVMRETLPDDILRELMGAS